jgi:hypothetical protein
MNSLSLKKHLNIQTQIPHKTDPHLASLKIRWRSQFQTRPTFAHPMNKQRSPRFFTKTKSNPYWPHANTQQGYIKSSFFHKIHQTEDALKLCISNKLYGKCWVEDCQWIILHSCGIDAFVIEGDLLCAWLSGSTATVDRDKHKQKQLHRSEHQRAVQAFPSKCMPTQLQCISNKKSCVMWVVQNLQFWKRLRHMYKMCCKGEV